MVLGGGDRRLAAEERVEQVGELGRSRFLGGFVGEEKVFELDAFWDKELVEVLEDRGTGTEFWMYWSLFRTLDDHHVPCGIILQ